MRASLFEPFTEIDLPLADRRDGKVRIIYKDWPIFGPPSERAASVALASAEQGIYPAVHRALMTDSRIIDDDMLREIVTGVGGDWTRATAWLAANTQAVTARLRAIGQQASAIGLSGTPGYLAGPMLVMGAIGMVVVRRRLDSLLRT